MSIKILSESEIKQVANSYQAPAVLFANPKKSLPTQSETFKRRSTKSSSI